MRIKNPQQASLPGASEASTIPGGADQNDRDQTMANFSSAENSHIQQVL